MRLPTLAILSLTVLGGCLLPGEDAPEAPLLGEVLGESASAGDTSDNLTPPNGATGTFPTSNPPSGPTGNPTVPVDELAVRGNVGGAGDYRLYQLGASSAGDEWQIGEGATGGTFVVVLLDSELNLLARAYLARGDSLRHVLREATSRLLVGVMSPSGSDGGDFDYLAQRQGGQPIPAPQAQVVWLNFDGASDVRVHGNAPISFGAFDGAMIDERYAGQTTAIRDSIVDIMRADYAAYNVTLLTSHESPQPGGPHAVVHFGGNEPGLLGLADSVDEYNRELQQTAVIYIAGFAPYREMNLSPSQMGVMIGNVGSHELGHLLGLYHTRDPDDVMDTTGTAWELADDQAFRRAALEATVFAVGLADAPELLSQGVGRNPTPVSSVTKAAAQRVAKTPLAAVLRRFSAARMPSQCGTCMRIDERR